MKWSVHGNDVWHVISNIILSISETMSEAVKLLKGEYVITALEEHKMDKALIFCRTKLDCDNLEKYLQERGQGMGHYRGARYILGII